MHAPQRATTGRVPVTVEAAAAVSIATIWTFRRRRRGNIAVPGHDIPMVQTRGRTEYPVKREAAIKGWFGDDIETMLTIA
jgi:hypothetical protein